MTVEYQTNSLSSTEKTDLTREHLTWHEVMPGRYERGIDGAEQFYTSLAKLYEGTGRTYFALVGHVSISCSVPDGEDYASYALRVKDALREAWLSLRCSHPTIATHVEWCSKQERFIKIYEALDRYQDLQLDNDWLNGTFQILSGFSTARDWYKSDAPAPQRPTLFVFQPDIVADGNTRSKIQHDLVLRFPHDVTDGIGILQLIECLLDYASKSLERESPYQIHDHSDEWKMLSPPLRLALGTPSCPDQNAKSMFDEAWTQDGLDIKHSEILAVPCTKNATVPARSQRAEVVLSRTKTAHLLSVCKAREISITHAYHAAIIVFLTYIQPRGQTRRPARYADHGYINLRSQCRYPYDTQSHAAAVYHSILPRRLVVDVTIPTSSDPGWDRLQTPYVATEFQRVLSIVRSFYCEMRAKEYLTQLAPLGWQACTPALPSDMSRPPPIPAPSTNPSVSLSSMGVFDKIVNHQHGPFAVDDVWVAGDELGNALGLFLGSFKDQLTLSATFNEAWHSLEEVAEFLHNCNLIVSHSLDLSDSDI